MDAGYVVSDRESPWGPYREFFTDDEGGTGFGNNPRTQRWYERPFPDAPHRDAWSPVRPLSKWSVRTESVLERLRSTFVDRVPSMAGRVNRMFSMHRGALEAAVEFALRQDEEERIAATLSGLTLTRGEGGDSGSYMVLRDGKRTKWRIARNGNEPASSPLAWSLHHDEHGLMAEEGRRKDLVRGLAERLSGAAPMYEKE